MFGKNSFDFLSNVEDETVKAKAIEVYKTYMLQFCGDDQPFMDPKRLEEAHLEAKRLAEEVLEEEMDAQPRFLIPRVLSVQIPQSVSTTAVASSTTSEPQDDLFKELSEMFKSMLTKNEDKANSTVGTPVAMMLIALVGLVISIVGGQLNSYAVMEVGWLKEIASGAMLALWAYAKYTGTMKGFSSKMDTIAVTCLKTLLGNEVWTNIAVEIMKTLQSVSRTADPQKESAEGVSSSQASAPTTTDDESKKEE